VSSFRFRWETAIAAGVASKAARRASIRTWSLALRVIDEIDRNLQMLLDCSKD
jgi:hypothetical protein